MAFHLLWPPLLSILWVAQNAILLIAFLFSGVFVLYLWFCSLRLIKCCELLPGPRFIPGITYMQMLRLTYGRKDGIHPLAIAMQIGGGYCHIFNAKKIWRIWILTRPFVVFFNAEATEVLLSSNVTIDKSKEYDFLHPWLGTGLLTSTGNKWRTRRKMLTPTFHFRILEDFMPVFNEQSMVLVQKILKESTLKPVMDIVPLMTTCTLDIICETAMGVKMHAQSGGYAEYVKAVNEIGEVFLGRCLRPWLLWDKLFFCLPSGRKFRSNLKQVHGFTRKVIKEKKEFLQQQMYGNQTMDNRNSYSSEGKKRKAFLELLLEHHLQDETFTEEDIREEVDTFMFEGHDTTAMALGFALYNLGLRPNIQEKVIQEIDSIFGDDTERSVTSEDLRQMKYTECVIKETLRLYPSVPVIARELKENIKVVGYTIAPGSLCIVIPFFLHRDPNIYPDPEKFDPERFSPENSTGRHPYAYIPFSAGPRNCIGQKFALMEEKTLIANIFRNMSVQSLDQRDKVLLIPDLILRSTIPLRLKITPRSREQRN